MRVVQQRISVQQEHIVKDEFQVVQTVLHIIRVMSELLEKLLVILVSHDDLVNLVLIEQLQHNVLLEHIGKHIKDIIEKQHLVKHVLHEHQVRHEQLVVPQHQRVVHGNIGMFMVEVVHLTRRIIVHHPLIHDEIILQINVRHFMHIVVIKDEQQVKER
ncbi:hypothetical protein IJU97_02175 [bacterium]|nr:hypothetical protein [bacterium]